MKNPNIPRSSILNYIQVSDSSLEKFRNFDQTHTLKSPISSSKLSYISKLSKSPVPYSGDDLVSLGPNGLIEIQSSNNHAPICSSVLNQSIDDLKPRKKLNARSNSLKYDDKTKINPSHSFNKKKKIEIPSTNSNTIENHLIESMNTCAKKFFGINELNNFQITAINACFKKKNVFIVVSTGAGKSLCYQLPAVMPEAGIKFTLVVSPLVSLMEDQLSSLKEKRIPSTVLSGINKTLWNDINKGLYRLVYCTPEYVNRHLDELKSNFVDSVLLIAIDECHCVSEWGHNFRPTYRQLPKLRKVFPEVPLICLTATATKEVEIDIVRSFSFKPHNTIHFKGSMNRNNIFYGVKHRCNSIHDDFDPFFNFSSRNISSQISNIIVNNSCIGPYSSTLIYVATKNEAENLALALQEKGVSCSPYHAGLSNSDRACVHQRFLKDDIQVVCATIAFGMGIDKPDVRRIIHWCIPSSIEAYVQQAGRAGRDTLESESIIIWSPKDVAKTRTIILLPTQNESGNNNYKEKLLKMLNKVVEYLNLDSNCRREYLLRYFNENVKNIQLNTTEGVCNNLKLDDGSYIVRCDFCDICLKNKNTNKKNNENNTTPIVSIDLSNEVAIILKCILACKEKTGISIPCKMAMGSKSKDIILRNLQKSDIFGKGSDKSLQWWKELVLLLKYQDFISEKLLTSHGKNKMPYVTVYLTEKGHKFLLTEPHEPFIITNPSKIISLPFKEVLCLHDTLNIPELDTCSYSNHFKNLNEIQNLIREKLMSLRLSEARMTSKPPFLVFPMPSIEKMVELLPVTMNQLKQFIPNIPFGTSNDFLTKCVEVIQIIVNKYNLDPSEVSLKNKPPFAQSSYGFVHQLPESVNNISFAESSLKFSSDSVVESSPINANSIEDSLDGNSSSRQVELSPIDMTQFETYFL